MQAVCNNELQGSCREENEGREFSRAPFFFRRVAAL
jgi:hypothetical protein